MVGSSAMAGLIAGTGSGIVKQYSLGGESSSVRDVADHAAVVEAVPRLRGRPRRQRPLFVELSAAGASGQGLRLSVVSSDDGGGGDGEGGDPVFGSPRQHALLVMLAGVRGADAGGPRGGAFLQGLGSAVVLLPRVDTRARVWAGRRRGASGVDVHKGLGFAILVTAVLACPDKASRAAKYWNWFHRYVGPRLRRWGDHRCDFGDQKVHCEWLAPFAVQNWHKFDGSKRCSGIRFKTGAGA
ncbi:unnamed protein product [Musa hybrid cultivar]